MLRPIIINIINNKITELDLSNKQLTLNMIKDIVFALKTNSSINSIDLSFNNIKEKGAKKFAEVLEENNSLRTLDFTAGLIGDEGVKALAAALEKNIYIHTLNLSDNLIGDKGAIALASMLKTNKSLHTLNLSFNYDIGPAGLKALAESLPYNNVILNIEGISYLEVKNYIDRNIILLEETINKAINYDPSKEHNISPEDIFILKSHKQIVEDKLTNQKKFYYLSKIWRLVDNANYEDLEHKLFDLLNLPFKKNAATSLLNSKNTEEYKKLDELFNEDKLSKVLEDFQERYNNSDKESYNELKPLWDDIINQAAGIYDWSNEQTASIKSLDIDGKDLKSKVMNSLIFHCLYPQYRDLSYIVQEHMDDIKDALVGSKANNESADFIQLLSEAFFPSKIHSQLNKMLCEVRQVNPLLFEKNPSKDDATGLNFKENSPGKEEEQPAEVGKQNTSPASEEQPFTSINEIIEVTLSGDQI